MHLREVIAAGGGTLSDTLHIVWATITFFFDDAQIGFGTATSGKGFPMYTIVSFIAFILFGALIGMESPRYTGRPPNTIDRNQGAYQYWCFYVLDYCVCLGTNKKECTVKVN